MTGMTSCQLEGAEVGLQIYLWYLQRFEKKKLVPLTTGIAYDARIPSSKEIIVERERHRAPLVVGDVPLHARTLRGAALSS